MFQNFLHISWDCSCFLSPSLPASIVPQLRSLTLDQPQFPDLVSHWCAAKFESCDLTVSDQNSRIKFSWVCMLNISSQIFCAVNVRQLWTVFYLKYHSSLSQTPSQWSSHFLAICACSNNNQLLTSFLRYFHPELASHSLSGTSISFFPEISRWRRCPNVAWQLSLVTSLGRTSLFRMVTRKGGAGWAAGLAVCMYRWMSAWAIMKPGSLQMKWSMVKKMVWAWQPRLWWASSISTRCIGDPLPSLAWWETTPSLDLPSWWIIHNVGCKCWIKNGDEPTAGM